MKLFQQKSVIEKYDDVKSFVEKHTTSERMISFSRQNGFTRPVLHR